MYSEHSLLTLQVLQYYLGSSITGVVAYASETYALLHFDVELDSGQKERVKGILHSSKGPMQEVVVRPRLPALVKY